MSHSWKYQDRECGVRVKLCTLQFLFWSPTRITCHNLGDLCTESAELVLQGGGPVQRRHPGLPEPLHSFALTAEVGHRWVPVEHQERRGPPLVFQRTTVTPENRTESDQIYWEVTFIISNLTGMSPASEVCCMPSGASLSIYLLLRKRPGAIPQA